MTYSIGQIKDVLSSLDSICAMEPFVSQFLADIQKCEHPNKSMQSTADRVNMKIQTMVPLLEKLVELRWVYSSQMKDACHHEFTVDDFEIQTCRDDNGCGTKRVRYCVHCEKVAQ